MVIAIATTNAQNYLINFTASGVVTTLDSIKVENLTQSTSRTIIGGDTLHLFNSSTGGINNIASLEEKILISPNPMHGEALLSFYAKQSGSVQLFIYDISGKIIMQTEDNIIEGIQKYKLNNLAQGVFFVSITGPNYFYTAKLISLNNSAPDKVNIEFRSVENIPISNTQINTRKQTLMAYNTGDNLRFRGYSGAYIEMELDVPTSSKTINFSYNYSNVKGYYASPNGTGNGTYSSPFKIADFWAVAQPGDTLNLFDGHYIGANSMIKPPANFSGTANNRIVIRAINDGMVDIDGEMKNAPVSLGYNNYLTLEGFNAHHAGSTSSINVTVVNLNYSSNNILRRICAWEASDGNTNIFGVHNGSYNLLEDCAGWGTARKTFSNSQQGNYTTFRRCFGRWEGSHAEGPKKTFGFSYNSYNALLENCIATWDGLKMKQNYQLHDYNGNGTGSYYSNYEVQQPDGMFSHDGFDVLPDVANARLYGCIAYLKANQRYHNSFKKWAAPFAVEIKGVDIKDALSYIQPGSHTDIWNVNLASVGSTTTNTVNSLTRIGGTAGTVSSQWNPQNVTYSATCGSVQTANVITKRYINGVKTNQDLWPWPMNQRIIDAMKQGGYTPLDVTKEIFGLCP